MSANYFPFTILLTKNSYPLLSPSCFPKFEAMVIYLCGVARNGCVHIRVESEIGSCSGPLTRRLRFVPPPPCTFTAMADDIVLPIPNLNLPQHFFTLSTPSLSHLHEQAAKDLLTGIEADRKCPFRSAPNVVCGAGDVEWGAPPFSKYRVTKRR